MICGLNTEEVQQIRAALMFWNQLAVNSRKHPSRHPYVVPYFQHTAPMSIDAIQHLVAALGSKEPELGPEPTVPEICKVTGWKRSWVYDALRRANIQPVRRGRYRRTDLASLYLDAQRAAKAAPR